MKHILFAFAVLVVAVRGEAAVNAPEGAYRAIGQINNFCAGTLIGPNLVLTAGHCVYDLESKKALPAESFALARNSVRETFGSVPVDKVYVNPNYISGDSTQDVAVLVLREAIGLRLGWLNIAWDRAGSLLGGLDGSGTIAGYPGDEANGSALIIGGPQGEPLIVGVYPDVFLSHSNKDFVQAILQIYSR